jgi:hypothetical protein
MSRPSAVIRVCVCVRLCYVCIRHYRPRTCTTHTHMCGPGACRALSAVEHSASELLSVPGLASPPAQHLLIVS